MTFFLSFLGGIFVGHIGAFSLQHYLKNPYFQGNCSFYDILFFPQNFVRHESLLLWLKGGTGFIFSLAFIQLGASFEGLIYAFLGFFLFFLSLVDFKKYIIPDNVLLCVSSLYLINENFCFIFSDWIKFYILFCVAFFLKIGYLLAIRKNVLGWGDVKLFSLCGLWLNGELIPTFLFITGSGGIFLGYLWRHKGWGNYFPLGPAICLALWIIMGFERR